MEKTSPNSNTNIFSVCKSFTCTIKRIHQEIMGNTQSYKCSAGQFLKPYSQFSDTMLNLMCLSHNYKIFKDFSSFLLRKSNYRAQNWILMGIRQLIKSPQILNVTRSIDHGSTYISKVFHTNLSLLRNKVFNLPQDYSSNWVSLPHLNTWRGPKSYCSLIHHAFVDVNGRPALS